ncbi:MAG: UPF0179 family protein [Candidatus Ranarchaeia archaeon]
MPEEKKITMISKEQAIIGHKFEYLGPLKECENCDFITVCHHNLNKTRVYEITKIKKLTHKCILTENEVSVVEVTIPDLNALLDKRRALEGVSFTFKDNPCNETYCEFYINCHPSGIKNGDRCKVITVDKKIKIQCPIERQLKKVEIRRT